MRNFKTISYWTIDDHPNPDKCFDWIRANWHDLGQDDVYEMGESLRALSDQIGCAIDYCISILPARGEYVRADTASYDHGKFLSLYQRREDFPLTGISYDLAVLDGFNGGRESLEHSVLCALHSQGEWMYSEDGLRDLCEANDHLFDESGDLL